MRKILSLVLSLAMVMSCFGMTAFAADEATNTLPGITTNVGPTFNEACYTPDTTVWTTAEAEIQPADGNGTYVGKGKYYTNTVLGGSGDNVTAVLMTNASATDNKAILSMNNTATFNNRTDLEDTDRIHYSFYLNLLQGAVNNVNLLPAAAGGINITTDLLAGTKYLNNKIGQWVKFDVFYQPTITYTYTKTSKTDASDSTTGTWKSNMLQNPRVSNDVTSGVDFSKMPGYDSNYTYTSTNTVHGLTSCYINGEPMVVDVAVKSGHIGTRDWDNLASRLAFFGNGVFAVSKPRCELVKNFDANTYDFVEYPELASGEKYTVDGSNIIYNQAITAADITAPAGFEVAVYSDAAFTKENNGTINLGDIVVVRNGDTVKYYSASDGKNVITTTLSSIQRSTHSEYTTPLAGKAAPFTKITKPNADADNAYFEVGFGSYYPSIDTEKYYVLEMNYLPESDGAYLYFGGQQSSGLGVANLTLTNSTLVQNQWNKIVVVLENGSTEANPYPANKKDYASMADAKAASPHTISLYCNGKAVTTGAKTQLGMIWSNGGRAENFFRIQVLPKNTSAETYAYVDDVVFYATDNFSAANAALPEFDMTSIGGTYIGGRLYLAADAADINAIEGLTVLGKTEGAVEKGDVIAYTDGKDVAYYTVAGSNKIADRDGNANSIGWEVDGTTLRIYDIPDVGTPRMPNGCGENNVALFPWIGLTGITDIVVEDGINHLGQWTVFGFKNLNSVTIPSSVIAMDGYAFNGASMTTLTFEEGCKGFVGSVINRDCTITNLYMPSTANPVGRFWRGINTADTDMPYNSTNTTVNIYAVEGTDAYEWANTVKTNAPVVNGTTITVNVNTDHSDRIYTWVKKSYDTGLKVNNGAGALATGASGKSYDSAFECYSTTESQGNAFFGPSAFNKDLFDSKKYVVLESDVKFTENSGYFFTGTNSHRHISPSVFPSTVLVKDGWNKVVTVVEFATGKAKTYVNGMSFIDSNSNINTSSTDDSIRYIFYNNDNGISETVPVGYLDNMAVYATDVNPADAYTAPFTASAYDATTGVTFTASADVKALKSNIVIAAAYDANDNMVGNVVMGAGEATIAPVSGATKYVGYVWNSVEGLTPIAASITVDAQ